MYVKIKYCMRKLKVYKGQKCETRKPEIPVTQKPELPIIQKPELPVIQKPENSFQNLSSKSVALIFTYLI